MRIKSSKKTRSRTKRKSAHMVLVEEADAWVKAIVMDRQEGQCLIARMRKATNVSCGGPLHGAHILRKGGIYISLRHDLENVVILCRNHHMFWAHIYEHDFYEWIEQIYPGRIAKLKLAAQMSRKQDLKELICVLKSIHGTPPSTPVTQEWAEPAF